ncbi:MAG: ATP-binding cassette domain-containing protein [Cohaesibacter sp.]|nr:ATP-binding cassette domain-containing protein [Cohaesibacter sp.]
MTEAPVLQIENLSAWFPLNKGMFKPATHWIKAVQDITFSVRKGETLGLVGESGCGKSTLSRTILGLREANTGRIILNGHDMTNKSEAEQRPLRREAQMIFQDPNASLDPMRRVGQIIRAGLDIHGIGTRLERASRVADILTKVGLDPSMANRFPHEFSGGQRQRIGIARALIMEPKFIICDEPVSALDVSIQSQILNLLKDIQAERQLAYLFVSHNLAVVEHMVDRIAVMYMGRIVEIGQRNALLHTPLHPYTKALLSAVPASHPRKRKRHVTLEGDLPSLLNMPKGCALQSRCPMVTAKCKVELPTLVAAGSEHKVACWNFEQTTSIEWEQSIGAHKKTTS